MIRVCEEAREAEIERIEAGLDDDQETVKDPP